MRSLEIAAGVRSGLISPPYKGKDCKNDALKDIRGPGGPLTIYFSGHGGKKHIYLRNEAYSTNLNDPLAISYKEFGDALLARDNLDQVTVLIDACYSYNFCRNLLDYLEGSGAQSLPMLISSNNNNMLGYDEFGASVHAVQQRNGGHLTVQDIFDAEERAFDKQDLGIFVSIHPGVIENAFGIEIHKELRLHWKLRQYLNSKNEHKLLISIFNIYNRHNPFTVNFNKIVDESGNLLVPLDHSEPPELQPSLMYLYGMIPSVSYQFSF